ncbi:MAG: SAF domain-containing protein [Kineosporiaceae bacterium]
MIRFAPPAPSRVRTLARRVARHRRPLAALLAAAAAWTATSAVVSVAAPATVPVVVAARDLPAGTVLGPDDVHETAWPRTLAPDRAAGRAAVVGAALARTVTRGEALTGPAVSTGGSVPHAPGRVRVVVGLADPWSAVLVVPGTVVDVHLPTGVPGELAGWPGGSDGDPVAAPAAPLARRAVVVQVLGGADDTGDAAGLLPGAAPDPGASALVVSATPTEAGRLAAVAGQGLAVTVPHATGG